MANVIVAFSKPEDARSIKNILARSGFSVAAVCNSGTQALTQMENLSSGLVVCGYRLADMLYRELHDNMPSEFAMLMISSPSKWDSNMPPDMVCLPMPLKVHDLVSTLEMMAQAQARRRRRERQKPKKRSDQEKGVMDQAKKLLMERNGMSENEAHRYIQKCSMDSGTNLMETAQMVISLINI